MSIEKKLKLLRHNLDLTQAEMADSIGLSRPHYSQLESGKRAISLKVLDALFQKHGVNTDEWFDVKTTLDHSLQSYHGNIEKVNKEENKSNPIKFDKDYETNKIDFYYSHSDHRIEKLLSLRTNDLKETYEAYNKLVNAANQLGAPDSFKEKFSINRTFKEYKKVTDDEILDYNSHVSDKKLLKCIRLTYYENEINHYNSLIYMIIQYIDRRAFIFVKGQ